jgi:hypothetical protein
MDCGGSMPESQVFFFGAGASKAEGGLLTSELLFKSLKSTEVDLRYSSIVKAFLKDLFRVGDVAKIRSVEEMPGFEELLTIVDVALLKHEEFSAEWNKEKLLRLQQALIFCMAKILRIELRSPGGERRYQRYHRLFIQNLLDDRTRVSHSFISLNYDILLDYALLNQYPRLDVDYGVSFRNVRRPRSGRSVKLLKLHGSLNWAFCPVCNNLWLSLGGKISDRIVSDSMRCNRGHNQQPLLIPPTWLKVYDNVYLKKIWLDAENTLRDADAVFFIGYSLPESDFHIRYLLKKSLHRKNTYPRIVAITKPDNPEGSDLHKRYRRFFGDIEYHPIGFEEFANSVHTYCS